jgi:hypothetical protein
MRVLLLRPRPANDSFGLGPFSEWRRWGSNIWARRSSVTATRSPSPTSASLRDRLPGCATSRPQLVGISCLHALEYGDVLLVAEEIRRVAPEAFIVVGGHAAALKSCCPNLPEYWKKGLPDRGPRPAAQQQARLANYALSQRTAGPQPNLLGAKILDNNGPGKDSDGYRGLAALRRHLPGDPEQPPAATVPSISQPCKRLDGKRREYEHRME